MSPLDTRDGHWDWDDPPDADEVAANTRATLWIFVIAGVAVVALGAGVTWLAVKLLVWYVTHG